MPTQLIFWYSVCSGMLRTLGNAIILDVKGHQQAARALDYNHVSANGGRRGGPTGTPSRSGGVVAVVRKGRLATQQWAKSCR